MEDLKIIEKIRHGDVGAYALLVEKYHRQLLTFIYRMVRDEQMVEDIGQEVFFAVYKSLNDFDERKRTPFSAWLFIAARNRCISVLRERLREKRDGLEEIAALPDGTQSAEDMLLDQERMAAVTAALGQVPEPFRKTILMSLEGNSIEDIANTEGITIGTVKSRLFRGRERMRQLVIEFFGEKDHERV